MYLYLSVCLSVCLAGCPSVCLLVSRSVCLYICLCAMYLCVFITLCLCVRASFLYVKGLCHQGCVRACMCVCVCLCVCVCVRGEDLWKWSSMFDFKNVHHFLFLHCSNCRRREKQWADSKCYHKGSSQMFTATPQNEEI